jgi:hypothetical protein
MNLLKQKQNYKLRISGGVFWVEAHKYNDGGWRLIDFDTRREYIVADDGRKLRSFDCPTF